MGCWVNNNIQITHWWRGSNKYEHECCEFSAFPAHMSTDELETDIHIVVFTGYKVLIHGSSSLFGNEIIILQCQVLTLYLSTHFTNASKDKPSSYFTGTALKLM